ncbi:hypothetical protein BY996DRAFT_6541599 [Phakopsora pachyrhizi]|nr:hypothetical protein BY996DRAFT_6541599 [Phakopsora pachyrhizi]
MLTAVQVATGQAAIPAGRVMGGGVRGRPAISSKAGASDVARVGSDGSWCGRRVPAIQQLEERSGDCSATDLGGGTDPGWAVKGKGMGKEGGRGLGSRTPLPREPSPQLPNSFGMVPKEGRSRLGAEGGDWKYRWLTSDGDKPAPLPNQSLLVEEEAERRGPEQGGFAGRAGSEEKRPETAAPQPRAGDPEGDEELGGEKEEELLGNRVANLLAAIAARGQEWGLRRRPRAGLCIRRATRTFLQDVAGPTGQEAGFNTRDAASGAEIARWVSKKRHRKGMLKDCGKNGGRHHSNSLGDVEEGSTRVATVAENYQKREQAGLGRVGTAGRVMGISQNQQRKGISQGRQHIAEPTTQGDIAGPTTQTKAGIRFGGTKIGRGRRAAGEDIKGDRDGEKGEGEIIRKIKEKEKINGPYQERYRTLIKTCRNKHSRVQAGKGREVSVGLVGQRLEDQSRTDIGGISKAVIGRAVGQDCWAGLTF